MLKIRRLTVLNALVKDTAELEGRYNKYFCHILTSPYDDAYH